ncbi:MAG: hypothetical protein H7A41_05975 [Chlamydiales bacterium]|nr:hypothetical protein [Chlamydiales bacterium]
MSETKNVDSARITDLYDDYNALIMGEQSEKPVKKEVESSDSTEQKAEAIAQDVIQKSEVSKDETAKTEVEKTDVVAQEVISPTQPQEEPPKIEDTIASEAPQTASQVVEHSHTEETQVQRQEETPAEEIVQQQEEVKPATPPTVETKAAPQKVAFPPLALRKISRGDVRRMDAALVDQHIPKRTRDIRWDPTRQVVVIRKSRRTRAYKIGNGSGPSLVESKNKNFVLDYLKRM